MFWRKKEEPVQKNFADLNHLQPELKILLVKGQSLVEQTRKALSENFFDMTSKNQLKTDCRRVEKGIRAISDGKTDAATVANLENAVICLKTTLDGVLQFFGC